jgi:hypothetical protein
MEISEQTRLELEEKKRLEYAEWNKKINEVANDVISLLREKQLNIADCNEVVKIVNQIIGMTVGTLNINYVVNNKENN